MGIIKDCPRSSMEKCTDKYGCQGACAAVEQFEKEWREESSKKREWVGLTEQEQSDIAWEKDKSRIWIVTATEAKLKEKNNASS